MAEIPLRAYIREISQKIDEGQTSEAITQCRLVLEKFPKYVETYRQLGRALKQDKQFEEAADLFSRVLSSIPDDFIAHLGMSLLREQEGSLDEAIWHAQRAYDAKPVDGDVHELLNRLFEKRDGVAPGKIRLTRGALITMYIRGKLYQQAISELRSALDDAPYRLDLQTLLADLCDKSNQRLEAIKLASSILEKLPNCMVALRVMENCLAATERDAEAQGYRQTLTQLNPYAAFINLETPDMEDVPDEAVIIQVPDPVSPSILAAGVALSDIAAGKESGSAEFPTGTGDTLQVWLQAMTPALGLEQLQGDNEELPEWIYARPENEVEPPITESIIPEMMTTTEITGKQETASDWLLEEQAPDSEVDTKPVTVSPDLGKAVETAAIFLALDGKGEEGTQVEALSAPTTDKSLSDKKTEWLLEEEDAVEYTNQDEALDWLKTLLVEKRPDSPIEETLLSTQEIEPLEIEISKPVSLAEEEMLNLDEDSALAWLESMTVRRESKATESIQSGVDTPLQEPQIDGGLIKARKLLSRGKLNKSLDLYKDLILAGDYVDLVIADLEAAAEKYSDNADVWLCLGDAYLNAEKVQDATRAYNKAETLL